MINEMWILFHPVLAQDQIESATEIKNSVPSGDVDRAWARQASIEPYSLFSEYLLAAGRVYLHPSASLLFEAKAVAVRGVDISGGGS